MNTIKLNQTQTKIIAHRGVSGLECENTCAAFVAAGNRSYYGIETDVHVTADGKFAVIHDNETGRVSPVNLSVEQSTMEQLSALTLYDPQSGATAMTRSDLRIPLLNEYIRICCSYGKTAVLELKNPMNQEHLAAIAQEIGDLGYLENTLFISFCFENLVALRKLYPQQPMQFLTGAWTDGLMDQLIQYNMGLDIHHGALTAERVAEAHQKGIEVNCWTVDDPARANELMGYGVDYITSNILE